LPSFAGLFKPKISGKEHILFTEYPNKRIVPVNHNLRFPNSRPKKKRRGSKDAADRVSGFHGGDDDLAEGAERSGSAKMKT